MSTGEPRERSHQLLTETALIGQARQARDEGFPFIAEAFEEIADRISRYNETHARTAEEMRQVLGEDEFWRLIFDDEPR